MANGEVKLCPFRDALCLGEECALWDNNSKMCIIVTLRDELYEIHGLLDSIQADVANLGIDISHMEIERG